MFIARLSIFKSLSQREMSAKNIVLQKETSSIAMNEPMQAYNINSRHSWMRDSRQRTFGHEVRHFKSLIFVVTKASLQDGLPEDSKLILGFENQF